MIDRVLARARGTVDNADALWRREEQTAVAFESGRLKAAGISEEAGLNLRVVSNGRMGVAGTTAAKPDPEALLERARASAELGEMVELAFPKSSPESLPPIPTYFDRTANASLAELIRMGKLLVERLVRPDCQINVAVEREIAETAVGNTAGARGEYRATGIAVVVDITRIAGDDVLMVYDQYVGADMPGDADLETLVRSVETRLPRRSRWSRRQRGRCRWYSRRPVSPPSCCRSSRRYQGRPYCREARRWRGRWAKRCSTNGCRSSTTR